MTLAAGTKLGPYEIVSPLGAGGMGEVHRARDTKLGREVALKVLPAAMASDAERMARFQREAQMLASLNHPNIASIYGLEESGGVRPLVMELVEGPTLTVAATLAGVILGTAAYISPEQAQRKRVDKRVDIWAFGVLLYEMLTGEHVFNGETTSNTLAAVIKREPNWDALPASTPASIRKMLRSITPDLQARKMGSPDAYLLRAERPHPRNRHRLFSLITIPKF